MRSLVLVIHLLVGCALCAQVSPEGSNKTQGADDPRPLTWREGAAIIQNARQNNAQIDPEQDCSHLVHDIYELAGLHYSYAPSADLYRGVDGFERVRTPQPGDLIVWRGHVGLVVDPSEHSFYSSLSTGPKTDTYDSPIWRHRGPVRFFRYLLHSGEHVRAITNSLRASVEEPSPLESEPPSDERGARTRSERLQSSIQPETETVLLNRDRPTKSAFEQALLQLWNNASDERQDRWEQADEAVIVQSLKIERIHLTGSTGVVDTKIKSAGRLTQDGADAKSVMQAVRFRLTRSKNGWRIEDSSGRLYLAGNAAIAAVSDRLSSIAREDGSRSEQVQTGNLLKTILR